MKKYVLTILSGLTLAWFVVAQEGTATITPPVLKATAEEISFATRISNFSSGGDYRVGVGTTGQKLNGLKVELLKDEAPLSKQVTSFKQGFASHWFNVNEILVQGFVLSGSDLPAKEGELVFKASLPRAEADQVKRLFLIVSKKYGPDVWYIVDGAEMDESDW